MPASPALHRLLLAACLLLFAGPAIALRYTVDDAYISFRYAHNLVEHADFTYNPGGPRVEGYTNLLWTLLMALALWLRLDPVPVAAGVGILAGIGVLLLSRALAARLGASPGVSLLAPALLAVNPALVTWSGAGLETSLFTALLLAGLLLALDPKRSPWAAGVPFGLACLTRPEGVYAAALVAAGLLATRGLAAWPVIRASGWLVALAVLPHEAFRLAYYGSWLPNTFYAKTGDLGAQLGAGFDYVYGGVLSFFGGPFLVLVIALALPVAGAAGRVTLLVLGGLLGYVVVVGGDGLPMFRFLVPALPLFAGLAAAALERVFREHRRLGLAAGLAAAALSAVPGLRSPGREYLDWDRNEFVPKLVRVGRELRGLVGERAKIALLPAGAIPYYSRLETVDMLALNDPVVARKKMQFVEQLPGHWKYDAAHVLAQRPDVLLLGNVDVTPEPRRGPIPPQLQVERELVELPAFQAGYRLESWQLEAGDWLNGYVRRDAEPRR